MSETGRAFTYLLL